MTMTAAQNIDYLHLARIAKKEQIPFEKLCERAETGRPLRTLVAPDEEWITYQETADILCSTITAMAGNFTHPHAEIEYWGIQWKSRSKLKDGAKRGCGVLFYRYDIQRVAQIKRAAGIGTLTALRVFEAIFLEKIRL